MRKQPTINECVYCDVQMNLEEGLEMLALVNALRATGEHPNLDEVFRWMGMQLEDSIASAADDSPGILGKPKPKH